MTPLTDKEIISSQAQRINLLKEKVVYMLEQLHKSSIKKDSSNSSLVPSADMFKKNRSLRIKSKLKSGGQFGHKGHALKMSLSPDKIIELKSSFSTFDDKI